jgi:hypothetical protein
MFLSFVLLFAAIHPISAAANQRSAAPIPEETDPRIIAALNAAAASLGWAGTVEGYTVHQASYYYSYTMDPQGCGDGAGRLEVFSAQGMEEDLGWSPPGTYENEQAGYDWTTVIESLDFHGHPAKKISDYDEWFDFNDQVHVLNLDEEFAWLMGDLLFQTNDSLAHEMECPDPFPADAQRLAEALYNAAVQNGLDTGSAPTDAPTPQASPTPGEQIVLRASKSGFSEDIQAYSNTANAGSVFIYGVVTDRISGEPLPNVTVEIISGAGPVSALTAEDGTYSLTAAVPGGSGSAEATLSFSLELTAELYIDVMAFVLDDFLADGESTVDVQAAVYDQQGSPLPGRTLQLTALVADGSPWGQITIQNTSTDDFGTAYATLTAAKNQPGAMTTQDPLPVTLIATDTVTGIEGRAQIDVNHYFPKVDYYPTLPTCADCSPYPITVTVLDLNENPVAGVTVTAQLQSGSGELMVDKLAGTGASQVSAETGPGGQATLFLKPAIPDLRSESALSILVYEEKTNTSANLQIKVEPLDIALGKVEQVAFTGVTNTNAYFYLYLKDMLHRDSPLDRLGLEKNSPVKYLVDIKQFYSDGSAVSPEYLETTYLTRSNSGGIVLKDFNNNPPTPHVVPVNDGVTFYRVRVDAVDNESGNLIYDPYLPNNDTIIAVRTGSPGGWLHTFLMNGALSPSNHTGAMIKCAAAFLPGLGDAVTLIDALNEGYKLSQSVQGNEWDLYALGQKLVDASAGGAAEAVGVSEKVAGRVGIAGKIAGCIKDHLSIEMKAGGQSTGTVSPGGALCLQIFRPGDPKGAINDFSGTFDPFFHGFISDLDGYQGVMVMTPPEGSAEVLDAAQTPVTSSWKTTENGVSLFILPTGQPFMLQMYSPGDANVTIYDPGDGTNRLTINHNVEPGGSMTGIINLGPGSDYALFLDTNADGQADQTLTPQITQLDTSRPNVTEYSPTDKTGSKATLSAAFQDEGGSGVDPASFKIVVDGVDLTTQADVTATAISVDVSNLPPGEHRVVVGVQDGDGNAGVAEWSFQSTDASMGGAGLPVVLISVLAGLIGLAGVVAFGIIFLRKPVPQPVPMGPPGYYPPPMAPSAPASSKRRLLLIAGL